MKRCVDLHKSANQQVYLCIYDQRLNRLTSYQSDEKFTWQACRDLIARAQKNKLQSHMAVRTYVGENIISQLSMEETKKDHYEGIPEEPPSPPRRRRRRMNGQHEENNSEKMLDKSFETTKKLKAPTTVTEK